MPSPKHPPAWRAVFLCALADYGNVQFAAAKAGVNPASAYASRKRDRGFAADWAARVAQGRAKVAAGSTRPVTGRSAPPTLTRPDRLTSACAPSAKRGARCGSSIRRITTPRIPRSAGSARPGARERR